MKRKMITHFIIILFLGTFLSGCAGVGVEIKEGYEKFKESFLKMINSVYLGNSWRDYVPFAVMLQRGGYT